MRRILQSESEHQNVVPQEGACSDAGNQAAMLSVFETTIARRVSLSGIGVHSGAPATLTLHPATGGTGLVVMRADKADVRQPFPLRYDHVRATALCTVVGISDEVSVSTVEHLMAALRVLAIDNALIEIDGPEMPIMDGSAQPFIELIDLAGVRTLRQARQFVRVLKPVRVERGSSWAELRPAARGFKVDITIDFEQSFIGRQRFVGEVTGEGFRRELARARTFGFLKDVQPLLDKGFARGSSTENTVVVGDEGVVNPEGLRWADEFVRHKTLDAIGDLALSGAPLIGSYTAYRSGHALNVAMLEALFADDSAWEMADCLTQNGNAPLRLAERGNGPRAVLQPVKD